MNEVIRPNLLLSLFTTFTYKRIITLNFKEVLLQLLNHFLEVYLFCLHTFYYNQSICLLRIAIWFLKIRMIKNRIRCKKCKHVKSKVVKLIGMNSVKWECAIKRDLNIQ